MDQEKPIAHASRTLQLPAEKADSQIEKEALSIIFAVTKFHRYLHGRFFNLQTDHKPFLTIFGSKKRLPVYNANRLLRWGTLLLNYNFKLEYLPTNKIGHADGLSRLLPNQCQPLEDSGIAALWLDCEIKSIIENTVRDLPVTLSEIKSKAIKDDFINEIKQKIASKDNGVSDVYSLCDSILLYSDRVAIPKKLQKLILKDFHTGHPGKNRMKSLMWSYVYWPAMDKDIIDMINAYRGCVLAAKAPATTFKPWPKTDQPWSRIHIDFAGPLEDHYNLIVVDSYSKWLEILRCKRPATAVTIGFLHELFAKIRSARLYRQWQWHTIYIGWIQGFLNHIPGEICNNATITPKIEWSGGMVRQHAKKSTQESKRNTDRQSLTTIPTGVSYNAEPKYTFNRLTSRNHVCQENKICIRQINPETI